MGIIHLLMRYETKIYQRKIQPQKLGVNYWGLWTVYAS